MELKDAQLVIDDIQTEAFKIHLIELRSLKPLDMDTIRNSLEIRKSLGSCNYWHTNSIGFDHFELLICSSVHTPQCNL